MSKPMDIEIRNAKFEDASDIAKVHKNSWLSTYRGIVSESYLEKVVDRYNSGESQKRREDAISVDNGESFFVATFENKVIGFAKGGKNRFPDIPYDAEIYAIYIEKEFQGKGIGNQLFHHFIDHYLIPAGLKSLSIHVLEKNPSCGFYKKMGGDLYLSKLEDIADARLEVHVFSWNKLG